eukprot:EG_transcript_28681
MTFPSLLIPAPSSPADRPAQSLAGLVWGPTVLVWAPVAAALLASPATAGRTGPIVGTALHSALTSLQLAFWGACPFIPASITTVSLTPPPSAAGSDRQAWQYSPVSPACATHLVPPPSLPGRVHCRPMADTARL